MRLGPLGTIVGLNVGTYTFDIDQSRLGNGKNVYIGTIANATITATTPYGALSDNVYRFGASVGGTMTLQAPALLVNPTTGTNSLTVGMPFVRNTQTGTIAGFTGTVAVNRNQTYSGYTTIFNSSTLTLTSPNAAAMVGNRLGTGTTVNILGTLSTSTENYNPTDVVLYPYQMTQTTFNIYNGGLFDINNAGVTGVNVNRRINPTSDLNIIGGIFRFLGDDASANNSTQNVDVVTAWGQANVDLRRAAAGGDGTATLNIANLVRASGSNAIISFTNNNLPSTSFANSLATLGVAQLNGATPSAGMLPAYIVNGSSNQYLQWSGGTITDVTPTAYAGGTAAGGTVSGISTAYTTAAGDSAYAVRASANISGTSSLQIRSGGILTAPTATLTVSAPVSFNNGSSNVEAVVFAGGSAAVSFTNTITAAGLTKGGAQAMVISPGTNNSNRGNVGLLSGPITLNTGTLQLGHQFALGGGDINNPYSTSGVPQVSLWGGTYQPNVPNTFFLNDLLAKATSTIGANQANTKFRNLTVEEMPVPIVINSANTGRSPTTVGTSLTVTTNATFMSGNFTANGPTLLTTVQNLVVEGKLQGAGSIDKWGNNTLALLSGTSSYTGAIRVFQGTLQMQDGRSVVSQFGTGMVDVMPGAILRLASPTGLAVGAKADSSQAVVNFDTGTNGITSVTLPAAAGGKYYHVAPKIRVNPADGGFAFITAELTADIDPVSGRIVGIRVINPGNYFGGTPTIEIDAPALRTLNTRTIRRSAAKWRFIAIERA
ncbi:MAG: hypothetical protein QM775_13300 [Pirellulales bacterium]